MSEREILNLSGRFPDADETQWTALVEKALKGKPVDRLNSKTDDGMTRKALYRETDWAASEDPYGVPGTAPYIRGRNPFNDRFLPWDIRQSFAHPDPEATNAEILADLESGVSSIDLRIDPDGERGVMIRTVEDLNLALNGVFTELAGVGVLSVGDAMFGLETAALLTAWAETKGLSAATQKFHFNVDPIGELARCGSLSEPFTEAMDRTTQFVVETGSQYAVGTSLRADGRTVHEAGGSDAQELAMLIASGVEYVRRLLAAGIDLETACGNILFAVAVDADYTLQIAKLRAARRLWARVIEAFDSEASYPMLLQAKTSRRMMTSRDPWVNLLRTTAACFAAGVGGADMVTVRPFTDTLGLPDALARRLARNTQIIAQEESFLGRVTDPAGGAWTAGALSDDLAKEAWVIFQGIEAEGGIGAALQNDWLQPKVADVRNARRQEIASRKRPVTGVSEFALLDEVEPAKETPDLDALRQKRPDPAGSPPGSANWAALLDAAKAGTSITQLNALPTEDGAIGSPLWPSRLAEPFERLRDASDLYLKRTGERPKVFLATLGALADHNARATFAANFFAAGGIQAISADGTFDDPSKVADAFAGSSCLLACICGSDKQYEGMATQAAELLKAKREDARVYLAGNPGNNREAWSSAGIDEFIHIGVDVVAALELAHAELGVGADLT